MAAATQKITLSSSRDIPFNKLVLSQSNVRRVKAGISVEELAESIARRGLIQSLHVRPELDAEGQDTGLFEVPAGGRRYRALELLVKQKRLNKTTPVPCIVSEASDDILIDEVSLAENIERAPLHPLDQFRAFQVLREKGMSEEEIAAAFFVNAKVVKQRLRLVSVSPALLDVYAEDSMTLEQLMAFTVSDDQARQEQVWEAIKDGWQKEQYTIRRMLTETTVRASDKRALFVGIESYEAAGGYVLRDLFQQDDGGWLQDPVLLDRLVGEKLKAEAETIAAEGWKWIEVAADFPYGHTSGMRRLAGTTIDLTDEERADREKLRDEFEALQAEYAEADELPDEVDARLGEIEEALEAFETRPMRYDADQMARAGVFVSIRHDGQLAVERGYVHPEDEVVEGQGSDGADGASAEGGDDGSVRRAVITVGSAAPETDEDEEVDTIRPLPDRLVSELTAHRTLALRDAVASNPHVAMTALLHRLNSLPAMARMKTPRRTRSRPWSLPNDAQAGWPLLPRHIPSVSATCPILVTGLFLWRTLMPATIDIDRIFRENRASLPSERTLPWEETCDGITVVVEPKPHWADDMRAFRLERREYCRYTDWAANGGHARFYGHIDTSGDEVMMRARAMIAREIADGLWD
ncbi:ParB/RepB/Spo0J family partition protein [Pacificitalea manganoxidans]|nr:ParB/RepB/Spo0J family partition protein [Pacificitalea manganoxidans]MDR6309050.1 ParB/RepB/Spo0J family partition protein [Pacificitalea manganoxidans]